MNKRTYVKPTVTLKKYERSYLDMLCELHDTVEADAIPQADKRLILDKIEEVEALIEPYTT